MMEKVFQKETKLTTHHQNIHSGFLKSRTGDRHGDNLVLEDYLVMVSC